MSRLPPRAKDIARYKLLQKPELVSGHGTVIAFKLDKEEQKSTIKTESDDDWSEENTDSLCILKYLEKNPEKLAQIEAAIAALYHLSEPDLIPKVRAVYRKETKESAPEFFATSSKRFSNFMSLKDYLGSNFGVRGYEAQTKEKLDVLIASGFAEVLALSYFYEEDDLHKDNIGIVYETVDGKTVVKKVVRVDFDMSAFSIVGQEQFRGPRPVAEDYIPFYSKKSAEERFAISDHNIKYFPFLKPAVPGEEMGGQPHYHPTIKQIITASHGYTDAEIAEFSKLSENKDFQKRSYLAFLKITLTPDRTIKNTLAEHIADPEILDIFYHHFVVRKKKLRNAVENCDKYKLFWEKLCDEKDFSNSSIQKMFSKMRIRNFSLKVEQSDLLNMDMDEVAKSYNAFCLVMSDEKIIESVHYLTNLIEFLHADDLAQGKEAKFKALHEPSVTLRNEIMNAHAALCENKEAPPSEDLEFFFRKMLDALKKFALSIKPSDKSKLSKLSLFIDSIENSLRQFIHHSYFIKECFVLELKELDGIFSSLGPQESPGQVFVKKPPVLELGRLASKTLSWVQAVKPGERNADQLENKAVMLVIFTSLLDEFEKEPTTLIAGARDLASSAVSQTFEASAQVATQAVSYLYSRFSFWGGTAAAVTPAPVVQPKPESPKALTLVEELRGIRSEIERSKTPDQLLKAINNLLVIPDTIIKNFRNKFFSRIIHQYIRDFSSMPIRDQITDNARLAEYLRAQPNKQIPEAEIMSVVSLFKENMEPSSETFKEDDVDSDFCLVSQPGFKTSEEAFVTRGFRSK